MSCPDVTVAFICKLQVRVMVHIDLGEPFFFIKLASMAAFTTLGGVSSAIPELHLSSTPKQVSHVM